MKTKFAIRTIFLSLAFSASLFSKSSHHFVVVKNDTNHDIILVEFQQATESHKHTISPHSEKKCDFFKSTEYVEARVKNSTATYNVGSSITSNTKTISITQNQVLHVHAQ